MDSFGQGYLIVAIVVAVIWTVWLWLLTRYGAKGMALKISVGVYAMSFVIEDRGSRALAGAKGLVRLLGLIGIVLGLVDHFRRPRDPGAGTGAGS